MKMKKKVLDGLNEQIKNELYAAYVYLSMSAYFSAQNLKGFASWMRQQSGEEVEHAMKILDYLLERNVDVQLSAIDAPPTDWGSPLAAVQQAHKLEEDNSIDIAALFDLAVAENDRATVISLQWFITEQVQEESAANELLQKVKQADDAPGALFILDQTLGTRE